MANKLEKGFNGNRVFLKAVFMFGTLFSGCCIVGIIVPFYLLFAGDSCPSCDSHCSSSQLLSLDCGKNDPEMKEDMEKNLTNLLAEELALVKIVGNENLERTKGLIEDAKDSYSHYLHEAYKCNVGIETCEHARETAQALLLDEVRLSSLWEKRARKQGWKVKKKREQK